jgi:regulator of Ty1 transposition protein 103
MAYTDDAVLARLSGLNDTHDSIATAAQWIMFHRYAASKSYIVDVMGLLTLPKEACRPHRATVDAAAERLVCIQATQSHLSCQWYEHKSTTVPALSEPSMAHHQDDAYLPRCFAEVAQQSRIRHKEDFIIAFSPVMAEATSLAYKGAPSEVQTRLRRVVDVWKDRSIFEKPIQEAIDNRLNGEPRDPRTGW